MLYPIRVIIIGIAAGLKATITAYMTTSDLDVEFEDGVVVKNKTYQNFRKGNIKHPDTSTHKNDRVGIKIL